MNPIREKLKNLMAILPRILSMAASAISAFSPAPQDFLLKMMKSFSFSFWLPGKARLAIASIVLSGGLGHLGTPAWSETAQPGHDQPPMVKPPVQ